MDSFPAVVTEQIFIIIRPPLHDLKSFLTFCGIRPYYIHRITPGFDSQKTNHMQASTISTGPLARRLFVAVGPVTHNYYWPVWATKFLLFFS